MFANLSTALAQHFELHNALNTPAFEAFERQDHFIGNRLTVVAQDADEHLAKCFKERDDMIKKIIPLPKWRTTMSRWIVNVRRAFVNHFGLVPPRIRANRNMQRLIADRVELKKRNERLFKEMMQAWTIEMRDAAHDFPR